MSWQGSLIPQADSRPPAWAIAVGYVAIFLLLDWASFIRPYQGLNITPWNPHPALAIALLLWHPRWLMAVWISLVSAELIVRGWPESPGVALAAVTTLTLSYGAIASLLRQQLGPRFAVTSRRDVYVLIGTSIVGALLNAIFYLATITAGGLGPEGPSFSAVARYWVGDAVGLLVMLPMLLAWLDGERRAELWGVLRSGNWWSVAAFVLVLMLFTFNREHHEPFKFFYLLLLPVIWAAARMGLAGAILVSALTQVGLIVTVQSGTSADLTVFELQVLMAVLTLTSLLLGVAVDERRTAERQRDGSLRMAAAGQMAAALAHELSQPMTAVNSYAQAMRLLASSPDLPPEQRLARLTEVAERMADEALRASEVVKRLRDFFRTGSTMLTCVPLSRLVSDAVGEAARQARARGIRLEVAQQAFDPVLVDKVQIGVVLRNLLANAMEAAGADGRVEIRASVSDRFARIDVLDSGPGVDAARLQQLFEPGHSDKPAGMGIGLSICRAIVEAHGGRLTVVSGSSGIFRLELPIESSKAAAPQDEL